MPCRAAALTVTLERVPLPPLPPPPARPRKLSRLEIRSRYPLACAIDPATRRVTVPSEWRRMNLQPVNIRPGLPVAWLHKRAVGTFTRWFQLCAEHDVLEHIESNDGGFVPRLMRGVDVPVSQDGLSLHSYGIALDVNAIHNQRSTRGAQLGQPGCLLALVPYAYQAGLVWGGDWHGASCDPMHFEIGER